MWKPCRVEGSRVEPELDVALSCAEALADLHAKGWAHGDVQPSHFIAGHRRAQLIDLALAHGQPVVEAVDFPFRGGLVHYEAPEISRSVLAHGTAVPTLEADVYALGATFFISATGTRRRVSGRRATPRAASGRCRRATPSGDRAGGVRRAHRGDAEARSGGPADHRRGVRGAGLLR